VAGRLTKVKPQAPIHGVIVGFVIHAHATQGKIYVKVDNGYELDELHNVRIVSPTNNQILQYTSATGLWENKTVSFASGTVTSVSGTGSYGGLSLTGTVTSSGSLTFGGTPTGTWPIGVTGNAGTVTNGVYTTGDQTIAGIKTFSSSVDAPSFRDSANTAYYLDPANTGTSMVVAGNVGIGATSVGQKLLVRQDQNDSTRIAVSNQDSGSSADSGIRLSSFGGSWDIANGSSAKNTNALTFGQVGGSERMRINSAGNVLIGAGATASLGKLVVSEASSGTAVIALESQGSWNSTIACTSTGNLVLRNNGASDRMVFDPYGNIITYGPMFASIYYDNDNSAFYLDPNNTGTSLNVAGSIVAAGNVTAYSDIRVKDNVEDITDAVDKLNQIRGVTYTRTDLDDKERKYAGVIAQEIEQVLPEAVFDNGKVKAVDYNATIALLIEAVKEQQKRIDKLETLLNKGN
jgi:hypothetical protein